MHEVTPKDVPANAQLIDVREDFEYAEDHAQGVKHIPMADIPARYQEIDPDRDVYVICKAGGRSMQVCDYLRTLWVGTMSSILQAAPMPGANRAYQWRSNFLLPQL